MFVKENPDRKKKKKNVTTLPKYLWELKVALNLSLTLAWSIANKVLPYSDISKKCLLCLHEKLEIINYPQPDELLVKDLS